MDIQLYKNHYYSRTMVTVFLVEFLCIKLFFLLHFIVSYMKVLFLLFERKGYKKTEAYL